MRENREYLVSISLLRLGMRRMYFKILEDSHDASNIEVETYIKEKKVNGIVEGWQISYNSVFRLVVNLLMTINPYLKDSINKLKPKGKDKEDFIITYHTIGHFGEDFLVFKKDDGSKESMDKSEMLDISRSNLPINSWKAKDVKLYEFASNLLYKINPKVSNKILGFGDKKIAL